MKRTIKIILLIGWMALIFLFSNQDATKSGELSNGFIHHTIVKVYEVFHPLASEEEKLAVVQECSYPIRKLAHFTVYFVLGVLVFLNLKEYTVIEKKEIFLLFLFCMLYAISDEIHQSFIPGRSCELKDVMIDSCGSLFGIGFTFFVGKIRLKRGLKSF